MRREEQQPADWSTQPSLVSQLPATASGGSAAPDRPARPWPRYWAKTLDLTLWLVVTAFIVGLLMPGLFLGLDPFTERLVYLLFLPITLAIDAVIISLFGTTPGKSLAGLRVLDATGGRISIGVSMRRNFLVWVRGLALGIPIVTLIAMYRAYRRVRSSGATSWDEGTDTGCYDFESNAWRTILTALALLALVFLVSGLAVLELDGEASG